MARTPPFDRTYQNLAADRYWNTSRTKALLTAPPVARHQRIERSEIQDSAQNLVTPLSKRDRQQFVLLHQMMAELSSDEDDVTYHAHMVDVFQRGFTAEYSDGFDSISDEIPIAECRLVYDRLDMFRVLGSSAESVGLNKIRALQAC